MTQVLSVQTTGTQVAESHNSALCCITPVTMDARIDPNLIGSTGNIGPRLQ